MFGAANFAWVITLPGKRSLHESVQKKRRQFPGGVDENKSEFKAY
jgi:hypothetical protein